MKNFWQVFQGVIIALVSIGLILGGFSLSMSEGNISNGLAPIPTLVPTLSPTLKPGATATVTLTPTPSLSPTSALTLTPSLTASLPPSPTNCPPPVGWLPYVVQPGDTFALIATRYATTSIVLQQANCLQATGLNAGLVIYVPPIVILKPTKIPISCGAPSGWIAYIVQPGDTLFHLSMSYGITVADLQRANCLGSSDLIHTGQRLYVPPWAPLFPTATFPFVFPTLTDTPSSGLPTDTPIVISTDTPVPVATDTPVEIPTDTLVPTTP